MYSSSPLIVLSIASFPFHPPHPYTHASPPAALSLIVDSYERMGVLFVLSSLLGNGHTDVIDRLMTFLTETSLISGLWFIFSLLLTFLSVSRGMFEFNECLYESCAPFFKICILSLCIYRLPMSLFFTNMTMLYTLFLMLYALPG